MTQNDDVNTPFLLQHHPRHNSRSAQRVCPPDSAWSPHRVHPARSPPPQAPGTQDRSSAGERSELHTALQTTDRQKASDHSFQCSYSDYLNNLTKGFTEGVTGEKGFPPQTGRSCSGDGHPPLGAQTSPRRPCALSLMKPRSDLVSTRPTRKASARVQSQSRLPLWIPGLVLSPFVHHQRRPALNRPRSHSGGWR